MNTFKTVALTLITLISGVTQAQKAGNLRIGGDLGYAMSKNGGGISYHIEPKYFVTDQINVGFKYGGTALIKEFDSTDPNLNGEKGNLSFNDSYIATLDYYVNKSERSFIPYVGLGLGAFKMDNFVLDFDNGELEFDAGTKFGGMVRGGFEVGQFRMGIEYMIIPESKLKGLDGDFEGSMANSYLNIHIGYFYDLSF